MLLETRPVGRRRETIYNFPLQKEQAYIIRNKERKRRQRERKHHVEWTTDGELFSWTRENWSVISHWIPKRLNPSLKEKERWERRKSSKRGRKKGDSGRQQTPLTVFHSAKSTNWRQCRRLVTRKLESYLNTRMADRQTSDNQHDLMKTTSTQLNSAVKISKSTNYYQNSRIVLLLLLFLSRLQRHGDDDEK